MAGTQSRNIGVYRQKWINPRSRVRIKPITIDAPAPPPGRIMSSLVGSGGLAGHGGIAGIGGGIAG